MEVLFYTFLITSYLLLCNPLVGNEPVLRSGESIKDAVNSILAHLAPNGLVEGLLFNCSSPEVITAAMPVLRNEISSLECHVRIGAYSKDRKSVV